MTAHRGPLESGEHPIPYVLDCKHCGKSFDFELDDEAAERMKVPGESLQDAIQEMYGTCEACHSLANGPSTGEA